MVGFEWKCEVCGCNMCADSDRKHRLTISYITQKIESRKKENIPTTYLVMSPSGWKKVVEEHTAWVIANIKPDKVDDFMINTDNGTHLFRGCEIVLSDRVPDHEVIPLWSVQQSPVVATGSKEDNYQGLGIPRVDWSRLPVGTYFSYEGGLYRFSGFRAGWRWQSFNGVGITGDPVDHYNHTCNESPCDIEYPDKAQLVFKSDEDEFMIVISKGDECVRPCLLLKEFQVYWGLTVTNIHTGEEVKVDRLALTGEYSMQWWYDNFKYDGYRRVGVGVYGRIDFD